MYLIYFDETKFEKKNPYFFIGGILIKDDIISDIEKDIMKVQLDFFGSSLLKIETELHGKLIFQGKGAYKKRKLPERLKLFEKIAQILIKYKIPIRLVCIDIKAHRDRYVHPAEEYSWGLQLVLERFSDFLDQEKDIGIVFGDYEKDEVTKAVKDFSQFKENNKTPLKGRSLERLKDTIYFTQSHHSRFLQVADMVLYMANRYENGYIPTKWHDKELKKIWNNLKNRVNFLIKRWPT